MSSSAGRVGPLSTSDVVGLLLACPISAHAFSPVFTRHYVRAAGPPVVVADVFSVCDPGSAFRLIVENGPAHERRISSGSIVLNGLEVVGENDFNARVARIERPLHHIVQDNRLEVRLTSKPAGAIALAIEGDQSCGVRITSPLAGSTLTAGVVAVRGTVQAPPGANVGVTINGFAALVETGQFAGLVPVSPEVTSLTARAVDFSGELGSDTVPVAVQRADPEPQLRLDATPAGGTAPLTVGFSVSSLAPIRSIALDLDGDGSVEFTGAGLDGRTFTYPHPGIYAATAHVTDDLGRHHTATALVQVADTAVLDARMQTVWRDLRDALVAGDLAGAATFVHSDSRAAYADLFNRFTPAALANLDAHMTTIRLVEVGPGGAQYEMLRDLDGQTLSFAVWFQLDRDGLWRIRRF
jgi:hypothetical protein